MNNFWVLHNLKDQNEILHSSGVFSEVYVIQKALLHFFKEEFIEHCIY